VGKITHNAIKKYVEDQGKVDIGEEYIELKNLGIVESK